MITGDLVPAGSSALRLRVRRSVATSCMIFTAVLAIAVGATANNVAHAAMLIEIIQNGSDVVANYSGSWETWNGNVIVVNDTAVFAAGMLAMPGTNNKENVTSGLTLQSGAWTAVLSRPDVATGDDFGFTDSFAWAPLNYTAGDPIEGSLRFNNTDLATMGFTLGDSGFFAGGGRTANFTVSAVPEPATVSMLAVGCVAAGLGYVRRRR